MLKLFALDLTTSQSAELTNLNIKTYGKFQERIKNLTSKISPIQ